VIGGGITYFRRINGFGYVLENRKMGYVLICQVPVMVIEPSKRQVFHKEFLQLKLEKNT
jgi:hypothetical protein